MNKDNVCLELRILSLCYSFIVEIYFITNIIYSLTESEEKVRRNRNRKLWELREGDAWANSEKLRSSQSRFGFHFPVVHHSIWSLLLFISFERPFLLPLANFNKGQFLSCIALFLISKQTISSRNGVKTSETIFIPIKKDYQQFVLSSCVPGRFSLFSILRLWHFSTLSKKKIIWELKNTLFWLLLVRHFYLDSFRHLLLR